MKKFIAQTIILGALLIPTSGFAATLYFQPTETKIGFDGTFTVDLYLDSREGVNALESTLIFPANLLELREISDGNSLISLWVRRPAAVEGVPGEIFFSGITPGGFYSEKGKVLSLKFLSKSPGEGAIGFRDPLAYENNGEGKKALLDARPAHVTVIAERAKVTATEPEDFEPPEEFEPIVSRDPNIFLNRWFVSFATQDKGSGIKGYFILETQGKFRQKDYGAAYWTPTESPYELKDQERKSYVYVRAVDNRDNVRVVMLSPQFRVAEFLLQVIIILIVLLALWLWSRRRKKVSRS